MFIMVCVYVCGYRYTVVPYIHWKVASPVIRTANFPESICIILFSESSRVDIRILSGVTCRQDTAQQDDHVVECDIDGERACRGRGVESGK